MDVEGVALARDNGHHRLCHDRMMRRSLLHCNVSSTMRLCTCSVALHHAVPLVEPMHNPEMSSYVSLGPCTPVFLQKSTGGKVQGQAL